MASPSPARATLRAVAEPPGVTVRADQRETFAMALRTTLNRRGKAYSADTIAAYLTAVEALDRWLTATRYPHGFDTMTVQSLNAFLAAYRSEHTQGGTVTKQQNLRVFLRFLAEEYDTEDLWLHPKRSRYQRADEAPAVLSRAVIEDLLRVTSGKSFEDRRDHALLRILIGGLRRTEAALMDVEHLDLTSMMKTAAVTGLKAHAGRRVGLGDKDALALRRWLTVRSKHRRVKDPARGALWINEKTGDRLTGNGIYQMLRRRAVQAGHPRDAVRPHLFRHTMAHDWLAGGGSEGNLMALAGWNDRSMVLRYGASMAQERALQAASVSGFSDRY